MDFVILSILFSVIVLSMIEDYMSNLQKGMVVTLLSVILISISGFKDVATTTDAPNYENIFLMNDNPLFELMTEPTYIYLSRLVIYLGGTVSVMFIIYALISIPIKLTAIWKMCPFFFTALVIYIGVYYPLHDIVQIRAGVAGAFLMLSVIAYVDRRYLLTGLMWLCAVMFHYSSVAFMPVYFIGNMRMNVYWKWAFGLLIPTTLVLYAAGIGAFSLLPSSLVSGKLDFYEQSTEKGDALSSLYVPYKQVNYLAEVILFYLYLFYYDYIAKKTKYANVILKIMVLALVYFVMLAQIPVVGSRMHDLLAIFSIMGFSYCVYLVEPKWIPKLCIAAFSVIYYLIQMFNEMYFS